MKYASIFRTLPALGMALWLSACSKSDDRADAYGNFEATATTVGAEAKGRLLFVNVEEGQRLSAGAVVAIVDTTVLDLQRRQIEATLRALPRKLRNTLADIAVLQKQKKNLERERDRVQRLLARKSATQKQLDDMNGQVEVVERQIAALRSQTSTGNQAILSETEPLLAQVAVLDAQIRKSYIRNPIAGTVLTKLAEPHEVVGMGSPIYRLGQLDTMTLRFYADAVQLQSVRLGQQIEVLVDEGAEAYASLPGRVSWIAAEAEFTPKTIQTKEDRVNLVYAVKARVPNPDGRLKIGMPAEVRLKASGGGEAAEEAQP